jgi:hypothetical protein
VNFFEKLSMNLNLPHSEFLWFPGVRQKLIDSQSLNVAIAGLDVESEKIFEMYFYVIFVILSFDNMNNM